LLRHGESVLLDGAIVGRVTSGAYGHHLGAAVGQVMLDDPDFDATRVMVDVAGSQIEAELSRRPFYDAGNERLRA
jgi:glycine cleavage system aminomethyltransferase T